MNNRGIINQPKSDGGSSSKTFGSGKKFVRPKGFRRNLDANSTVLVGGSGHDVSVMGSSRNLNQTVRHNLDATISAPFNPKIKPCLGPVSLSSTTDLEFDAANDGDLDLDLVYNEYLQALMKQLVVKKTIRQHEEKLGDQILFQSEHLHKLKSTHMDLTNKIENLSLQSEIVEVLDKLKDGIDSIDEFCKKYDTCDYLKQLNDILRHESDLVTIRNIKPINTQEDYDELIFTISNLTNSLEKFYMSGRNFEGVNKLATSLKCFKELTEKVKSAAKKIDLLKNKAATVYITKSSDYFAEHGGYF